MDKILSARLDESAVSSLDSLARRLRSSKKKILEQAIKQFAAEIDRAQKFDVFRETHGAWRREESAECLVKEARRAFRDSLQRHQR
ncbi:MAG: ribbon-helix-helix protein, CopG family [Candidatus Aureabacteria bacterium]|nr:ribbon-helix-helix protein, CopG family [Candidatus Auribacterota bacterium]